MDFEDGSDSKPKNAFLISPSRMIVLTAFLFLFVSPSDEICDVTCTKGQFCFKERCSPCPNGYFQDTPIHQYTECKRWTFKPSFFNFVVKTPGTMTQDVEWTCKEGYELYRYTPGEYECRKPVPVTPDLVRTTTTENSTTNITTTEYELYTSEPPYTQPSENSLSLTKEVVTPLLIAVCNLIAISIIINIMFILALLYKHRSYKRRLNHNIKSPMYKASTKQVSPPHYNFSYFSSIVRRLGEDSKKFIHHLHDPSGTFIASSAIYFQKAECGNVETAFTKVCLDWVNRNKGNNHIETYIFKALRGIGRNDVIDETNLETGGTSTCSTPLITHNNGNNFPFFYLLVEALGVDDSKKLLVRLPDKSNTFNSRSSLEFRMADGTSIDLCLVETFVNWKRKNPQMENWPHCLFDLLTELERNDVKETFQDILSSQDHHC